MVIANKTGSSIFCLSKFDTIIGSLWTVFVPTNLYYFYLFIFFYVLTAQFYNRN